MYRNSWALQENTEGKWKKNGRENRNNKSSLKTASHPGRKTEEVTEAHFLEDKRKRAGRLNKCDY